MDYKIQKEKIKKGWEIFQKENIACNIWIAPSHTFDKYTLKALKELTTIDIISDGIALFPFKKYGFKWIPQQLWKFRKMPFGVWTSCFHPNTMTDIEFNNLEDFIKNNHQNFLNVNSLKYNNSFFAKLMNGLFINFYKIIYKIKKRV